jgi:hypothetical protein
MPTDMKRHKVDDEILAQALDRHTEALFKRRAGSESTPYRHDPDSAELFRINKRLYETLAPVEPSDVFVEQLKGRVLQMHATETQRRKAPRKADKRNWMRTAVSVYAAATIGAQVIGSILLVIAFIITRRRRAAAAAA